MKRRKEKFFSDLENQLIKYFSIQDAREIIEDYKVFFNEKEAENFDIDEIISGLGEPHEITQELVKDKVYEINLLRKFSSMEKIRLLLIALWISVGIILLLVIQKSYMPPIPGILLAIIHIGLYWYTFVYRKNLLSNKKKKKNKNLILIFLALISIGLIYYNFTFLKLFSQDQTLMPFFKNLNPKEIGTFVHYQILITLGFCFFILYKLLLGTKNVFTQINFTFLFGLSIVLLIILHGQLTNLNSLSIFNNYLSNQLKLYTLIVIISGITQIYIFKTKKGDI